jgi:hypothetical protein
VNFTPGTPTALNQKAISQDRFQQDRFQNAFRVAFLISRPVQCATEHGARVVIRHERESSSSL